MSSAPVIWESDPQIFYFDCPGPVTALALAESLTGLQGMGKAGARALSKLCNIPVKEADVLIQSITLASFKDTWTYRFVFGTGRKAEKKLEEFRAFFKLDTMSGGTIAKVAVGGMLALAGYVFFKSYTSPEGQAARVHFENSFNTTVNLIGLEKEEGLRIFEQSVTAPEQLKRDLFHILRPDGQTPAGSIKFDAPDSSGPEIIIPAEAVAALPAKYEPPEKPTDSKSYKDIQIIVRALDLDSSAKGWHVIVPEVSEERLPMEVEESVEVNTIPAGKLFRASITVEYALIGKEMKARRVTLHKKL